MLLERPGELVAREEIQARLWPSGTIVEFEHSIGTAIKKLRQALGDDVGTPRYVETLPRRGYRFIALVDAKAPQVPARSESKAPIPKPRNWLPWAATALVILASIVAALFVYRKREPEPRAPRTLIRATYDAGLQSGPTWSPDGRFIAYSSDRGGKFDIWVQQLGGINPVKITTRVGHNWQPDWSPDGNQIVFRSEGEGGGLFVVPALGGPERRISTFGFYPKWSPDGRQILFGRTVISKLNKLYVVGLDGDPPREILTEFLTKSQVAARVVAWYPHSSRLSIWGYNAQGPSFWTVSLDGTSAVESGETASIKDFWNALLQDMSAQFRWGPSERVIYFEGSWHGVRNIWKISVDPSKMRFVAIEPQTTGPGPDTDLAVSADGKKLAYTARREEVRVWSYPFDSKQGRLSGDGRAVTPSGFKAWRADISPDGKMLSYIMERGGERELWQTSVPSGPATLLLRAPDWVTAPRWSPDSKRLGYSTSMPQHPSGLVLLPAGGGSAEFLTSRSFEGDLLDWSSDGQWVLAEQAIHRQTGGLQLRFLLLPVSAAPNVDTNARLVTTSRDEGEGIYEARLSPNGRWVVFEAVRGALGPGGATNATICIVPASGGPWIRVTDGQFWDDKPRWSPDGETIFYISQRSGLFNVWGIRFDPDQGRPRSVPFQVTSFESPRLMVAPEMDWQSLSLSQDQLVLSMKETSGSIWTLDKADK